ncbi:MAG: hypothetical protein OEY22_02220 [Candidatus Bathyarchaeota archaeon]|nr:hypothetical protein [Candidatus Bathyarchaeota archaeon]
MKITPSGLLNVILITMLVAALFLAIAKSPIEPYDPWVDANDDGFIDVKDILYVALRYGASGIPINKTELLELNLKIFNQQSQSGLLLTLPYAAAYFHPQYPVNCYAILHSLDIDSSQPGNQQSIFVRENATISISGTFQVYSPDDAPGDYAQVFFIYSWTPSWPPPNSTYYQTLYIGYPGIYPGVTQPFSFSLTLPNVETRGANSVFYLYFCGTFEYSMQNAVNAYTEPLWMPYAVIVVGP